MLDGEDLVETGACAGERNPPFLAARSASRPLDFRLLEVRKGRKLRLVDWIRLEEDAALEEIWALRDDRSCLGDVEMTELDLIRG